MDWIKAVLAFFGLVEKGEELVHDRNEEVAGENKVLAGENAENEKAERAASQALVDTDRSSALQQLRDGSA